MPKKISILGAGESGVGAALLAQKQGFDVFVSDKGEIAPVYQEELEQAGIPFESGQHNEDRILQSEEIIKSPGIPPYVPIIEKIREQSIPLISEIEFASRFTKAALVAITGTNGKTTTTALAEHLLLQEGWDVKAAGNIGNSFAREVFLQDREYFVLEISSFQLEDIENFHPQIAIILNITPDHLDRYDGDMELYAAAKLNIIKNQRENDVLIYDAENPYIRHHLKLVTHRPHLLGLSFENRMSSPAQRTPEYLRIDSLNFPYKEINLRGPHNYFNAAAAVLAAKVLGVSEASLREGLKSFKTAPHRLEEVTVEGGIRYVNDSKATNVEATYRALQSFEGPFVWIAGGVDKGNDYSSLSPLVKEKVRVLISLGERNLPLETFCRGKVDQVVVANSMPAAVQQAKKLALDGEVVLLSPACASFDLFKNYIDRGEQFKQACGSAPPSTP